jgi:hypothetical protein
MSPEDLANRGNLLALNQQQQLSFFNQSTERYNETVGLIMAAMYCSPQGRIGGLKDLKLGQVVELYEGSSTLLTDEFKTSARFGYQPILFPPLVKRALTFFLDKVRPWLELAYPSLTRPDSLLFASTRDPLKPADTTLHMSKFFQRTLGVFFK